MTRDDFKGMAIELSKNIYEESEEFIKKLYIDKEPVPFEELVIRVHSASTMFATRFCVELLERTLEFDE